MPRVLVVLLSLVGMPAGCARPDDPGPTVVVRDVTIVDVETGGERRAPTGVGRLTGTDVSSEPWVFAGSSVHDEMALFVEAGRTPLDALRAATVQPLRSLGRLATGRTHAAKGRR